MASIPEEAMYLLEGRHFAHVATLNADGSPQVTPVWIDHDGDTVLFNTAKGRIKERNLSRDGRVALSITDEANPYRPFAIQGRVSEITEEGADEHIDALAKRYLNEDTYPLRRPGEVRVKIAIRPEKVHFGMG